jgi:vacuolar-type H+-ATPase subunit F/Vma7
MSKDKRLTKAELEARDTMAIMGDEDSVTGFLIAGCVHLHFIFQCSLFCSLACITLAWLLFVEYASHFLHLFPRFSLGIGQGAGGKGKNFYICDKSTTNQREIERAFLEFTEVRKDIAIVLITQGVAQHIRHLVDAHTAAVSQLHVNGPNSFFSVLYVFT